MIENFIKGYKKAICEYRGMAYDENLLNNVNEIIEKDCNFFLNEYNDILKTLYTDYEKMGEDFLYARNFAHDYCEPTLKVAVDILGHFMIRQTICGKYYIESIYGTYDLI